MKGANVLYIDPFPVHDTVTSTFTHRCTLLLAAVKKASTYAPMKHHVFTFLLLLNKITIRGSHTLTMMFRFLLEKLLRFCLVLIFAK